MNRQRQNTRAFARRYPTHGYTLIEMLSVMSLMSLLMSLAVAWIIQSIQIDSKLRQRLNHHHMLMRIDRLLRSDVYVAESIEMNRPNTLLVHATDGRTAIYRLQENSIVYEIRQGQTRLRTESFPMDKDALAYWDSAEMPDAIQLIVERSGKIHPEGPVDLNVRAGIPDHSVFLPHNDTLLGVGH